MAQIQEGESIHRQLESGTESSILFYFVFSILPVPLLARPESENRLQFQDFLDKLCEIEGRFPTDSVRVPALV